MALLSKFLDDQVTVLDDFAIPAPKTREVAGILKSLGLTETSCLLTIEKHDDQIWRSSRNIPKLRVSPAGDLNAYELLRQTRLVVTRAALDQLTGRSGGDNVEPESESA